MVMKRSRITITLQADLLGRVDALVDGVRIKNRSHAIEGLLTEALGERHLRTAVILAGGRGIVSPEGELSRIFAPYQSKLFVEYVLGWLRREGIEEVIISAGEFASGVASRLGDGKKYGLHLSYLSRDEGTAGVLRLLTGRLRETFLLMNGDVLSDASLADMFEYHKQNRAVCTLAVASAAQPAPFGNVVLKGSRITDFIEKPPAGREESYLVSAGIYLMEPEIFNAVSPRHSSLERDLFPALARAGKLNGYFLSGKWVSLGKPEHKK